MKEEHNKTKYSVFAVEIAVPWSAVAVPSYGVRPIHNPARHLTVTTSVLLSFRPASGAVLCNNAVVQIASFFRMKQGDNRQGLRAFTLDSCGVHTMQGRNVAGSSS